MQNLIDVIYDTESKKTAIGHFNFANIGTFWAIVNAAERLKLPVILGVSEGERDYVGIAESVALVKTARERLSHPIFINADHTYSYERVIEAIDAGFDSVIFDGAKLPIDENIEITKKCVDYARQKGSNVVIEGELGYIGSSSKMLDDVPEGASIEEKDLTTAEDAVNYVEKTGVDLFSPSVGNLHGMLKNAKNPNLNIERIKKISEATKKPLVLHGGSGTSDSDFTAAIDSGVRVVHISTELRKKYRESLEKSLLQNRDELAPYRIMKEVRESVQEVVENRLKLFSKIN